MAKAHFNASRCFSDHSPSILSLQAGSPNEKPSFKFFNMWADHASFHSGKVGLENTVQWHIYVCIV